MFLENCEILDNIAISENYYLMKIASKKAILQSKPGQFFMLKLKNEINILRRPISLHNISKEEGILEFYYEIKGHGTNELSSLLKGEFINIQGPLGNGFSTNHENKNILIVAGGMGLAPCNFLSKELLNKNNVTLVSGGRNSPALNILKNFTLPHENIHLSTDDGSIGKKGSVIPIMEEIIKDSNIDYIMSCGPHKMMESVAKIAFNNNIPCEISLEERMACGVKACVGCSIKTLDGMKKVCYDGPVFKGEIIVDTSPQENDKCCTN